MIVTAIKPAVKNENRVNIFIDGKYDFSLEISQVVDLKLKVGKNLSEKELNDCRHASEFGKLYQRTLEYVLSRPHSEKEVRDHLNDKLRKREALNRQALRNREKLKRMSSAERAKNRSSFFRLQTKELPLFTDQDIKAVLSRLKEKGYLDDQKFAEFYVENRYVKKGISKKRLRLELSKKGIGPETIDAVLEKSERSDSAEIQKIIAKKQGKYAPEKLIAYLTRQGFDYQQSKDAVLEMDLQNSAQNLLW